MSQHGRRNYFMINLQESMGPDRDRTRDPWIRLESVARHVTDCAARCLAQVPTFQN